MKINDFNKQYKNRFAIKNINLDLGTTGITGILGPNGSGKTTLLKGISHLIKLNTGTLEIGNKVIINRSKAIDIPLKYISFFPIKSIDFNLSIEAFIETIRLVYNDFNYDKMIMMCNDLKLDLKSNIKSLSKGQKAGLNLALTLCREVQYFILDEPFDGIDIEMREYIIENIVQYVNIENSLLLISSHEIDDIERILDNFIFLYNGEVIEQTTIDNIRDEFNISLSEWFVNKLEEVTTWG